MRKRWNEMDDLDLLQLETEMRGELEELRAAATVYADRAWARGEHAVPVRAASRPGWMAWAGAGVAAAVLTLGGARLLHHSSPAAANNAVATGAAERVQQSSPVSDEALLDQIQSDITSGVPAAMDPLQASTEARGTQDAVKR